MPVSSEPSPITPVLGVHATNPDCVTYDVLRPDAVSPLLFLCDHGGQNIPQSLSHYDWSMALDKHIAFDIGAAHMTRYLSERFNAPAISGLYSRLVVDLNRFTYDSTFIPAISDHIAIPANENLSAEAIALRTDKYFAPYHMAVSNQIDKMTRQIGPVRIILVHSMTPQMNGKFRDQQAEVMFDKDDRVGRPLLEAFRRVGDFSVGENEPYQLDDTDYTAITHCARRGLPHCQIEIRQDLINTQDKAEIWAAHLGDAIQAAGLADPL